MPFRMHVCSVASAVSNSLWLYGLYVAHQAPLSVGFSRQYWSGLPCSPSGDAPDPEIQPASPALQADSLPLSHQGSPCHSPVTIQHEAWTWSYVRIWDEPHSFLFLIFFKFLFLLGYSWLTNSVVIVSGEQQKDSATHIHVSILLQTLLPSKLPPSIAQSSCAIQ